MFQLLRKKNRKSMGKALAKTKTGWLASNFLFICEKNDEEILNFQML
jgi:hypothetical protein